jgi:adenylate cyclase
MAEERAQRRLAAIMAADVVGYSRLMERDEQGTLARLKAHRRDLFDPKIEEHRGRIVKTTGDGLLLEFASVVDALRCAVEVQRGIAERNTTVLPEQRMEFRVGLNVGDIVIDAGDIYGDGVNVAARLEAMAEPGSICVSSRVMEDALGKVDLSFEDLGEQRLKNIARPVRVYRVGVGTETAATKAPLTIPDKPSIAVLPFENISGDPEQQYFSDGITEDIITELSRFRSLFVIARHSSFQYREKSPDVRRIGRDLGVSYIVEGSVRKSGDRIRITAQLIEATTGNHLWSERYDRSTADVFAIQDEVAESVVARIAGQLRIAETQKSRRMRTENLSAHDCFLRGLDLWNGTGPDASLKSAIWFRRALELDPDYAEPLTRLSISEAVQAVYKDSPDRFERGLELAKQAVALDPNNSWAHCALGVAELTSGSVADSANHFARAMQLNSNDPDQMMWCLTYHMYSGDFDTAQEMIMRAERLNPLPPPWYMVAKAITAYGLHDYGAGAKMLARLGDKADYWELCYLAACYERLGKTAEAKTTIAKALERKPNLSIRAVVLAEPYVRPDDLEHLVEPLRAVGLPE